MDRANDEKRYIEYEQLKRDLLRKVPYIEGYGYDEVVAVVRGGLTAAHILAKALRLPVGCWWPAAYGREAQLTLANPASKKLLFVEDLVAEGRTFRELERFMEARNHVGWTFLPVLVDRGSGYNFDLACYNTSEWLVFPYENMENMKAGDRGLFREGTDSYAK